MFLIAVVIFLSSSEIAFGQYMTETLYDGDTPICAMLGQAGLTWPIFGQVLAMLTAAALFMRPFANTLLKVSLALTAMPTPIAKTAGKLLWVLGTFAAIPAPGTPGMMKKAIKGEIESPMDKKAS